MITYLAGRIFQAALTIAVMSLLVFTGVFMLGDPVAVLISPEATQEDIARLRTDLGLDLPFHQQYLRFVSAALAGDLGESFAYRVPAIELVLERFPATLELAATGIVLSVLLGVPLGLYAGLKNGTAGSRLIMTLSTVGFSIPIFWVALVMIYVFAIWFGILPPSGRGDTRELFGIEFSFLTLDGWRYLALPALTLGIFNVSLIIRLTYAGTREVIDQDFIRFARAKGLRPRRIIGVHVLRNILILLVTVVGLEFGGLLAFAVVTETIFAWPGAGRLLLESIWVLDRPVIVAYLILTVTLFVIINLTVDLLYVVLDPRVRLGGAT
ncbi:MAG: ABC transporter permease [Pseudomonadota bacterium]